jgi:hypothetical protein
MTHSSRYDSPRPPCSSGITVAVQPISVIFFHSSASWSASLSSTLRTADGGQFSSRNRRAWSRSMFWSSENSKFMTSP